LTRKESRHSSRPNVFYFLPTAHPPVGRQLPTQISHDLFRFIGIAKALLASAETKSLSKSEIFVSPEEFLSFAYL